MDDGGCGNAEKLMVLSASPEALVSRDGFEACREGCREALKFGSSDGRAILYSCQSQPTNTRVR